jgi:hypothetical protein
MITQKKNPPHKGGFFHSSPNPINSKFENLTKNKIANNSNKGIISNRTIDRIDI